LTLVGLADEVFHQLAQHVALVELGLQAVPSDGYLRAYLNHSAGRNLEEVRGVRGRPRKPDEQVILPCRHARLRRRFERAAREEEITPSQSLLFDALRARTPSGNFARL
jgi:hypothetical protein